jgi:AbrB family looped-hinge helix DNA binding protein
MISTTLSSDFQLSIPKTICDALGLQAGQQLAIAAKGKVIELVPLLSMEEARGLLKGADPTDYRDRGHRYNVTTD